MGVTISGVEELKAKLKANVTLDDVKKWTMLNGSQMEEASQRMVPVRTGTLKRSKTETVGDGGLSYTLEYTAHYAPYVEYGTRFMAAEPYLRPAYNAQKDKYIQGLKNMMRK